MFEKRTENRSQLDTLVEHNDKRMDVVAERQTNGHSGKADTAVGWKEHEIMECYVK